MFSSTKQRSYFGKQRSYFAKIKVPLPKSDQPVCSIAHFQVAEDVPLGQEKEVGFCKSRVWFLLNPNFLDGVALTNAFHVSRRGHTCFGGTI